MDKFPTIEEIHEILDEIAEEIPEYFFEQLNEGIILIPEYKIHPESREMDRLYIMGEYSRSITGRHIVIYYGSFKKVYNGVSMRTLREKLKDTLLHEFTHHLESLAGERGLEIKDFQDIQIYRKKRTD
ncbi:metallopeptidase family protein [Proteiniborus sp.]|uniref:metallopeptidase family protein n=1 Tax=Proteiniborus sp. TaxID=2079015 RepID=UPI00331FF502